MREPIVGKWEPYTPALRTGVTTLSGEVVRGECYMRVVWYQPYSYPAKMWFRREYATKLDIMKSKFGG